MNQKTQKRCIMICPEFENRHLIDDLRRQYDPLAGHVAPHITLVFPFDSALTTAQLQAHTARSLSGIRPFTLRLCEIAPNDTFGFHLFAHVETGKSQIIDIHQRLYSGPLAPHYPDWLRGTDYLPHMTLGSLPNADALRRAVHTAANVTDVFETTVHTITGEIIDENEDSVLAFVHTL